MNDLSKFNILQAAGYFHGGGVFAFQAAICANPVDDILTLGIQAVEHGKCTHTAILPPLPQFLSPKILLSESTITENTLTGKTVNGPQLNDAAQRVAAYEGRVWFRPFFATVSILDWAAAYDAIGKKFGKDHYAVDHLFEDLAHAIKLPVHAEIGNSEVCCEYALEWLKAAGLANCPDPAGTTPEDLLSLNIYADTAQLAGAPAELR